MRVSSVRPIRLLLGAVAATAWLGALPSAAPAADQIYWASFVTDKISHANIDGSGGVQDLNTTGATVEEPIGVAIDPVGGRVYWANHTGGKISWANLDGSGGGDLETGMATVSAPVTVSVDVAARRIYWINNGPDKISWANLDGSGGGDLDLGAADIQTPGALAVFPGAGRVYWVNWTLLLGDGWVSYAKLDGTGGATLPITGANLETPFGIAIDAAAGRLYWANDNPGIISSANLDGSGAGDLDDRGLEIKGPYGLALDPEAGKLYTANSAGDSLAFVRTDGTGGATLPFSVDKGSGVDFPVLLFDPRPRGAPGAQGLLQFRKKKAAGRAGVSRRRGPRGNAIGISLSCSPGQWAGDLVEAFLYRAPLSTSVQWTQDGADLPGATSSFLSTKAAGNYRCRETATNRAGTTSQVSGVVAFFKVGGAKLNRRKGTARLSVDLPPGGVLAVSGKGIAPRSTSAAGQRNIVIRPTGKKRAKLHRSGAVSVQPKLTFTPAGGPAVSQTTATNLRLTTPQKGTAPPAQSH